MVNTRANSYSSATTLANGEAMATTTTITTTVPSATVSTTTTAMAPMMVTSAVATPAPSETNTSGSSLGQSTPETPNFSSITARTIQRERREQGDQAGTGQEHATVCQESQADAQLNAVINSAIGVGQMELVRLLDERLRLLVPQLVHQALEGTRGPTMQGFDQRANREIQASDQQPIGLAATHVVLTERPHLPPVGHARQACQITPHPQSAQPVQQRQYGTAAESQWPVFSAHQRGQPAAEMEYGGDYRYSQPPIQSHPAAAHMSPGRFQAPEYPHAPRRASPRKVDIEKWRLKFDGKSITAEDFMFRLEQLRQDFACDWDEVLVKFPQLLDGPAEDWYWMQRRLGRIKSFPDLKEAFLSQFRKFESDFDVQRKMMDRRQAPHESFEDFYNAVLRLRNQQREPLQEQMLVEMMKGNLKSSLAALVFPIRMFGLQHFREECRKAELLLTNQRQAAMAHRQQFAPRVSELEYEERDAELEVEAISRQNNYICWNCREKGHGFMDCRSTTRSLFCYGCGLENVVKPNCPRCKGNRQTGTTKGETRPHFANPQ